MSEYEGPRGTRKEELPALGALVGECFPGPPFNLNSGFRLFAEENAENLRIMLHQGRPVSHAGLVYFDLSILGCEVKVGCIGCVCTHPDYRNQGLAGRLLQDAWEKLRRDGIDFALISGNRSLYWRAGCGACRPTYTYMVPPGGGGAPLAGLAADDPRLHLDEMQKIYQAEPVHFCRSREDLEGITRPWPERSDKAVFARLEKRAYLVGWRWLMQEGGDFIEVLEYAGDRNLLAERAPALAAEFGLPLRFNVPAWEEEFRLGLEKVGRQSDFSDCQEGTIKILALGRLLEKLRPFWEPKMSKELAERLSFFQFLEEAEIGLGKENLKLKGQEAAELVFGTAEAKEWAPDRPALGEALKDLFPLPGPRYGLNFI